MNLFFIWFFIFVLSNAEYFKENELLYFSKHALVVVFAMLGFWRIMIFRKINSHELHFYILYFLFVFVNFLFGLNVAILFQSIVFFGAAYHLSHVVQCLNVKPKSIYILVFISLIPLVVDILLNGGVFLYNSYYGRPRLLMGYFHPKEAGNVFDVIFVMISVFMINAKRTMLYVLFGVFFILIYYIDSRNSLLFIATALTFGLLIRYIGDYASFVVFVVFIVLLPMFLVLEYYDVANVIMSLRLDVWSSALTNSHGMFGGVTNLLAFKYNVEHYDNYYVDTYVESGFFSLIIVFTLFCFLFVKLSNRPLVISGLPAMSIVYALFLQAFFDSGLFSTGNVLNLVAWAVIFLSIRALPSMCLKNRLQYHDRY